MRREISREDMKREGEQLLSGLEGSWRREGEGEEAEGNLTGNKGGKCGGTGGMKKE